MLDHRVRNETTIGCREPYVTDTLTTADLAMTEAIDGGAPTSEQIEKWERETVFATEDHSGPDLFPRLWNLSAGFTMRAVIRPLVPERAEYLTVSLPPRQASDDMAIKREVAIAKWNTLWEAGQFRRRFFDEEELSPDLSKIVDRGDLNIIFIPRTSSRYYEYAPLYHLLTRSTCERFGLPLLTGGQWPFVIKSADVCKYLPTDFEQRLSRAWASTVWRQLNSGSGLTAFSSDDPIRLLAHNLDYWIPAVTETIQDRLRAFPVVAGDGELPDRIQLVDGTVFEQAVPAWPRTGGELWLGEVDAAEVLALTVDRADSTGQLRGILDAVRSHRVEDDFSARWSYAREDFERRLYRKRNKVSVRFVELTDTIPVQGPDTEVEGRLVFADFMALLDQK
jgi:hypothetical protein